MIKISNIGTATRNNWILETAKGIIAVDTGLPGQAEGFLKRFRKKWPEEGLKYIFLTHAHNDHAGFIAELLAKTTAQLVLCEKSQHIIADGHPREKHEYKNWLGKILERAMQSLSAAYPAVTDTSRMKIVYDDDRFFEDFGIPARVVFLPGHTSDSIGLYLYENDAIICGDAAMNRPPLNANRHTVVIKNLSEYHRSWDKMLSMNSAMIYPGHGKPFGAADLKKYYSFMK